MWKRYLKTHLERSTKQEPFVGILKRKIQEQFEHLTPMERWTAMSLIENNKLIQRNENEKTFLEMSLEDDFEDTIYVCENCGCKKIDLVQKQLRGADEPMTCFFTCKQCGEKWTEN